MANRMSGSYRTKFPTRTERANKTRTPRGVAREMKKVKRGEAISRQLTNIDRGWYVSFTTGITTPAPISEF